MTPSHFGARLVDDEFIGLATVADEVALVRYVEGSQFEVIAELPQLVGGGAMAPLDSGILIIGTGPPDEANPYEGSIVIVFVDRSGSTRTLETPPFDETSSTGFSPGLVGSDQTRAFVQVENRLYEYAGGPELELVAELELGPVVTCVVNGKPMRVVTDNKQGRVSSAEDLKLIDWGLRTEVFDGTTWVDGPKPPKWINVLSPETWCSESGIYLGNKVDDTIVARLNPAAEAWEPFDPPPKRAPVSSSEPLVLTPTGIALLSSPGDDLPLPLEAELAGRLADTPEHRTLGVWAIGYPLDLEGFAQGDQWLLCASTSEPVKELDGLVVPDELTCTSSKG